MKFWGIFIVFVTITPADPLADCRALDHRGKRVESRTCFQKLTRATSPAVRAEAYWSLQDFTSANAQFKLAVAQQPTNADLRVRWGRMFLDGFNPAEADTLFKE